MERIPTAVVGAGQFGRNHMRILKQSPASTLAAVVDPNPERAAAAAQEFGCAACHSLEELPENVKAAVIAAPTTIHAALGCALLERGVDVLVEKPIASSLAEADQLLEAANRNQRILMVGHLERYNPAITELQKALTLPLFFEVHRLSPFTPRSLDVDVVLDLMIHDIDVVLALCGRMPEEIRASGISILSRKVDIANVRLAFPGGAIANLTASRVSTERVRKLRLFQPHQYIAVDYTRQDLAVFAVSPERRLDIRQLKPPQDEPLRLEVEAFLESVRTRETPRVHPEQARQALGVALTIQEKIEEHARVVAQTVAAWQSK